MRPFCDLHIHSTASDGKLAPAEIVKRAQQLGLRAISIADHDETGGILEALEAAENTGIEVISAVEINTDVEDRDVHILGYYIDLNNSRLQEELAKIRGKRVERAQQILGRLESFDIKIDLEEVLRIAGDGSVGRPHIAMALVAGGYVGNIEQAFRKYLGRHAKAFVRRYALTPQQAIEIILEACGIPVLAHPGNIRRDDIIPELMTFGLKGLEAYHCDHKEEMTKHYINLAHKYNLLVTGGTDSHGPHSEKPVDIGSIKVPYQLAKRLKQAYLAGLRK